MLRVGAHVSISGSKASHDDETPPYGNIANAVWREERVGGNCGQIFTHSPQVWQDPNVDDEEAEQFREATAETLDGGPWVIHSSYLVNLCTPKDDLREKSIDAMQKEVDAAAKLDIPYVNVHLGAHTGAGVERGLDNAASALDELDIPEGVTVLVESDAGSGTKLGGDFEHLAEVLARSEQDLDVCVDTAHAFAAGYDLSTPEGVDDAVAEFDDVVGLEHLQCIHLNDSKHECDTNKDEHAHIGEGYIGEAGMERIVNHPDLADLPFVLETPHEDGKGFAWNVEKVHELRDS
ncbi:deoxyribonuclease IV [Halospeciosus flavus]|uniref:Probable endonuclease 4 n=1 Tax=Halospeciosus flavus TaxID=3032283 RepID=A0ABD5Z5R1_9EURY|nr:deoxyribonuclease IV [Halospeciosus flavus]